MSERNSGKSKLFKPLVVKKSQPIQNCIIDEFYEKSNQSQRAIEKKCKAFSDELMVNTKVRLQDLEKSKLCHQKELEQYEAELKESEHWRSAMRTLQTYIQTNSKSQTFKDFVHQSLASFDERKSPKDNAVLSSSETFSQWKQSLVENFDNSIISASRQQSFQLIDLKLIHSYFQQLPESKILKYLPSLIDKIDESQSKLVSIIKSINQILPVESSAKQDEAPLEIKRTELEKLLEDATIVHLNGDLLDQGRLAIEKCEDFFAQVRLQKEMSAVLYSTMQKFPYISKAQNMALAIKEMNQHSFLAILQEQGQNDLQSQWQLIVRNVHSTSTKVALFRLSQFVITWSEFLLQIYLGIHKNLFPIAVSHSIDLCWEKYKESGSIQDATYGAVIVYGLYRLLTARAREEFGKVLKGKVYKNSLLIPNFFQSEKSINSTSSGTVPLVEQVNFALAIGSVIAYSADDVTHETSGPLDASFGWNYLIRSAQQLHYIVSKSSQQGSTVDTVSIDTACVVMYQFLQTAGHALFRSYQTKFEELLVGFEQIIARISNTTKNVQELRHLIQTALRERKMNPCYFNNQDPVVVNFTLQSSSCNFASERFGELLKLKDSPFALKYKALGLGRITLIFNSISATEESQRTACDKIIRKIVECHNEEKDILHYTLHKVVNCFLEFTQEESFIHSKEAEPLKFARVMCMVCTQLVDLGGLLRNLVYNTCPPLMPKLISERLDEDDFFRSLGFLWKGVKGSDEMKPEAIVSWLGRMEKVTTVVAVMSVQPEQTPFNIDDIWALISRMTNCVAQLPTTPFYLPPLLNILLRITSPFLMQKYGNRYVSLVRLISDHVFPKISEESTGKTMLKVFLDGFLNSNGRECTRFFSPDEVKK